KPARTRPRAEHRLIRRQRPARLRRSLAAADSSTGTATPGDRMDTGQSAHWPLSPSAPGAAPGEAGRVGERRPGRAAESARLAWFPPAPHRSVHAVLPHTAHRRSSPTRTGPTPAGDDELAPADPSAGHC